MATEKIVSEDRAAARDFAWNHFDLHAKQRIEVFKSYLTLMAIVFAGHGVAFQTKNDAIGIMLCVFQAAVSLLFYQLDCRTKDLVKLSEAFWKTEEERLASTLGNETIKIFSESDRLSASNKKSYGKILRQLFALNALFALVIFVVYLWT